jgi:predicted RNA polymerase sigma factor
MRILARVELRSAADDFDIAGEVATQALTDAVSRFPHDSEWPELERAWILLG